MSGFWSWKLAISRFTSNLPSSKSPTVERREAPRGTPARPPPNPIRTLRRSVQETHAQQRETGRVQPLVELRPSLSASRPWAQRPGSKRRRRDQPIRCGPGHNLDRCRWQLAGSREPCGTRLPSISSRSNGREGSSYKRTGSPSCACSMRFVVHQ